MNTLEIYQEVLLAHNENPNNFYAIEHPTNKAYGVNPTCGDEISVYLLLNKEGTLETVSFTGQGCAICKASASIMTLHLQGKTIAQAEADANQVLQVLNDPNAALPNHLDELEALIGVRKFPMRVKCATLAWHTFLKALRNEPTETPNCCCCRSNP